LVYNVERLVNAGADSGLQNSEGLTPLDYICKNSNPATRGELKSVIGLLLKNYDLEHVESTPIFEACAECKIDLIEIFYEQGGRFVKEIQGCGLHAIFSETYKASSFSNEQRIKMATLLIRKGGKINDVCPCNGLTPLHRACIENNTEMAKFLIDQGADKEPIDHSGKKPIHYAIEKSNIDIVRLLVLTQ
jgi:ankyrin repeat protein